MTLGNRLPDGSELVPGGSPWLSSRDPRSLGSRRLAESWGLGDQGQRGWLELASPQAGRQDRLRTGRSVKSISSEKEETGSPGGSPVTSSGVSLSPPGPGESP